MTDDQQARSIYHIEIHQAQGLVIGESAQVTQWHGDAEAHRRRVEGGVAAERAAQDKARLAQAAGTGVRVVGIKPDAGKYFLDRDQEREEIGGLLAYPSAQWVTMESAGIEGIEPLFELPSEHMPGKQDEDITLNVD